MRRRPLILVSSLCLAIVGCGGADDESPTSGDLYEAPVAEAVVTPYSWKRTLADGDDAGFQTAMTIGSDGNPKLAYLAYVGDYTWDPPSAPIKMASSDVDTDPAALSLPDDWEDKHPDPVFELRYAQWSGSNWRVESLAKVHMARGLSILETSDGEVVISFVDTDRGTGPERCQKSHLKAAVRSGGNWRFTKLDQSNISVDDLEPADLICESVGGWSSIAEGTQGKIGVAYRKATYDFEIDMNADSEQLFMEFTINSSGSAVPGVPEVVHDGLTTGLYGELIYASVDGSNLRPRLVYLDMDQTEDLNNDAGLWYASRGNGGWTRTEIQPLQNWLSGPNIQFLADGDTLYVMSYIWVSDMSNAKMDLVLLASTDDGLTWQEQYLEHEGRAGAFPSMAMTADGRLAVSYYQCGMRGDFTCDPENDGLMFSVRDSTSHVWDTYTITNDFEQIDGWHTALGFNGNSPVVAGRQMNRVGPGNGQALSVFFGELD